MAQLNRGKLPTINGEPTYTYNGANHRSAQSGPTEYQARIEARLDPPLSSTLIGVEPHVQHLSGLLTAPQAPWLVSLEGVDGLGKTRLADAVVRHAIPQKVYADIAWISIPLLQVGTLGQTGAAKTQPRPALSPESLTENLLHQLMPEILQIQHRSHEHLFDTLQARLRGKPHLIVIDNFKTAADISSLLPTLKKLANPSSFLLITPVNPPYAPHLQRISMPALSEPDALHLVRYEAKLRNLPHLASSDDGQLRPLVDLAGGHPLAIRLLVGQVHDQPLASLVDDLRSLREQPIAERYTSLLRYAWRNLTNEMQHTLLLMPLINPRGETLDYIAGVLGWEMDLMQAALEPLIQRNLIDVRHSIQPDGTLTARYSIHALTHRYLQKHIIGF